MSVLWISLVVALAMIGCVLIHRLFPGARKQLTVASMKPFGELTRPRVSLAKITERLLLISRLLLLLVVGLILFVEPPDLGANALANDVVGIVPGAPESEWRVLIEEGQQAIWLDRALTPVVSDVLPGSADVANALTRLDQVLKPGARLSVAGMPSANGWPDHMPRYSRPIRWLGGFSSVDAASLANLPDTLWVVGEQSELGDAIARSIELWQQAELVTNAFSVNASSPRDFDLPNEPAVVLWLADVPPPPVRRLDQTIVTLTPSDAGLYSDERLHFDVREPVGVFATTLWHAISRASARPASQSSVRPLPLDAALGVGEQRNISASSVNELSLFWLCLIVGLFTLERMLSLRGVRA